MTDFRIERLPFSKASLEAWSSLDSRHRNWPVVYVLDGEAGGRPRGSAYVGETSSASTRVRQHLDTKAGLGLSTIRVVVDESFNKSACLDLEAHLIRWLAGDGRFEMLNANQGITESDYYDRARYRASFQEIFDELRRSGVFERSIPEIENGDLFKLSPFKALTQDQAIAVEDIVEGLLEDLTSPASSEASRVPMVVEGYPGTGKTIIAIYIMKLLADIKEMTNLEDVDADTMFADLFTPENREALAGFRMALVVPQQSLRLSIKNVFRKTRGLSPSMVLTPFEVGSAADPFDLLLVDEAHRLSQRANQPSGMQNAKFRDINVALFGRDDKTKTQLDWIRERSAHQILLLDPEQTVKPADLPLVTTQDLARQARSAHRHYPLISQMRVQGGQNYIDFMRRLVRGRLPSGEGARFPNYDLRMFDSLALLREEIVNREKEEGLARIVAGYAWEWKSRRDKTAFDIELDGLCLRWNSTDKDWINSPRSLSEVGSIHTVQGYDLNYAGVIIGPDLRFDPVERRVYVDRESYKDVKGKENNKKLGITYSDDDLLEYIANIYAVLLTRGIRGTYVYVCDPALREYVQDVIPLSG